MKTKMYPALSHAFTCLLFHLELIYLAAGMPDGNPGHWCSRFPGGHEAQTTPGDNGYYIEVRDAVTKLVVSEFVPSNKYEVSISTNLYPFKGFALIAANPSSTFNDETYMGNFEIMDRKTTRFSENCQAMLTHSNPTEKQLVTALWYAPENTFVEPCVQFRATVVKSKKEFYMDQGNLTKKLCKESAAGEDVKNQLNKLWGEGSAADYLATNPSIRQCCACGRANYRINFGASWDQKTDVNGKTPFDYISPKWQSLIGASHDDTFSLWRYEELAPEHMRADMSMNPGKIQPQNIQNFLKENYRSVRTVIRMPDIPDALGDASAQFSVDKKFHLASFLAFLSPSPDWFVGFNSVDLCDQDCTWKELITINLFPIDAGTHSGDNFLSNREPLVQRQKVQDLRYLNRNNSNSPFYEQVPNSIPKFASVQLVRTAVRDDTCQASNYNPAFSANYDYASTMGGGGGAPEEYRGEEYGVDSSDTLCLWSEWGPWGECEASSRNGWCSQWGVRRRSRSSSTNMLHCNINSGLAEQQTSCMLELGPECAKDCVLGQWAEWSLCSKKCGGGWQDRYRSIYEQAQFGGKACPGESSLSQTRPCNTMPC